MDEIKLYENKEIRSVWDEEKEEWYFSVVDVVAVLTESKDPQVYWRVLKKRLKDEGNETVTNCNALKMKAADGKMRLTDVADMQGIFRIIQSIPSPKAGLESMISLNKYAADAVKGLDGIHACTDVTGFSVIGHSLEMCEGTGLGVVIDYRKVPMLPGVKEFAKMGLVPAATYANRRHLKKSVGLLSDIPEYITDVLYDPQTSGGLLYSVAKDKAEQVFEALKKVCPYTEIIGEISKGNEYPVSII